MAIAMSKIETNHWTKDQAAEGLFDRLGVAWEYVANLPINLIDRELSLQNQARLGVSLDTDVVDEYALAMLEGAVFPALVGFQLQNGTYLLAGGNHRLAAAKEAMLTHADLYLLRVNDDAMRRLVTTSLNTLVGVRPQRQETIEQAIAWMEMFGRSAKSAASFYGVPEYALTRELKIRSTRKRMALAGVSPSALSKVAQERLSVLQNDIVLREAAVLQSEAVLAERELKQMVSEIREQRTEAGQLAVIQHWRDRDDVKLRKAQAHKGIGVTDPTTKNRAEVFRTLRTAERLLGKYVSLGQVGLSNDQDYQEALMLARTIVERLEVLGATPR